MELSRELMILQFILFILTFILSLFGAYVNDFIQTLKGKDEKIHFIRILVSALSVTILLWAFSDAITKLWGLKPYFGLCFTVGIASYRITEKLTTEEGLKAFIEKFFSKK